MFLKCLSGVVVVTQDEFAYQEACGKHSTALWPVAVERSQHVRGRIFFLTANETGTNLFCVPVGNNSFSR